MSPIGHSPASIAPRPPAVTRGATASASADAPASAGDDVLVHVSDRTRELLEASAAHPENERTSGAESGPAGSTPLSEDERKQVEELEHTDREVRQHEAAHKLAAGAHAGAVQYSYTVGPDGRRYAVAGEVSIDLSPVANDPAATLRKMEQIARAALSPADPSGADHAVAAQARAAAARARQELAERRSSPAAAAGASASAPAARSYGSTDPAPRGGLLNAHA